MPSTRIDLFARVRGERSVRQLSKDMKILRNDVTSVTRAVRDVSNSFAAISAGA